MYKQIYPPLAKEDQLAEEEVWIPNSSHCYSSIEPKLLLRRDIFVGIYRAEMYSNYLTI